MFIYVKNDLPKLPNDNEKESVKDFRHFKHPIFQWRNDIVLSHPIKYVEKLIKGDLETTILSQFTGQFKEHLHQLVFSGKKLEEVCKNDALEFYQKTSCGRRLGKREVYFRCLDCEKEESALCEDCFVKSNHTDHRVCPVILSNYKVGMSCDCGNESQMNPQGFCPHHQASQMDTKELLAKFPEILFERCQYVLKKAFYGAVCMFELARIFTKDEKMQISLMIFAERSLQEVLNFCEDCFQEISESFLTIFGIVMSSKFLDPYNTVWHDCQDLKAETNLKKSRECGCTMMGNLFRLSSLLGEMNQAKLEKALLRESTRSREFLENLALEYSKYPFYLFNSDFTISNDPLLFQNISLNSNLATMGSKIYSDERVILKALKSGCFQSFINYFKWIIANADSVTGAFVQTVTQVVSQFEGIDSKWKSSSIFVKEFNILKEFLGIMKDFESNFRHKGKIHMSEIDDELLSNSMIVERLIRAVLYSGIWIICSFEEKEKIHWSKEFITNCYLNLFLLREFSGNINFHPGLQRSMTLLVINYMRYDMTRERIQAFFRDMGVESGKFAQDMIGGVLRVFGACRYRYAKERTLHASYHTLFLKTFDIDVATIQIMGGFLDCSKVFEILAENFFSYAVHIAEFFLNPNTRIFSKEEYRMMKDFLEFLVFLMNDELCLLNMKLDAKNVLNKESPLIPREKIVVEKAVKNVLIPVYSREYAQIKAALTDNFMPDHHEIQDIISNVVNIDAKDHKIRIKEEFMGDYEPYIFYRKPDLKEEYSASVASKLQKDENCDLVSGRFDLKQPEYLQVLQKNIYEGELGKFLSYFVSSFYQNIENTFSLLQPVLRLILLNLQVVNQQSCPILVEKITQNYSPPEFVNCLEIMSQDHSLKECWLCIKKIQILLKGGTLEEELKATEVSPKTHQKTPASISRMAKIKEEFAKKQDKFAHANKDLMLNDDAKPQPQEESPICQHCLEILSDKSEDYGTPIYITFTNNLYDIDKEVVFTKQDYDDLSKVSWWPVISSCHHYYHKKCYLEIYNKSFQSPDSSPDSNGKYYLDDFEFCCSLCKTICNNFVCVNNTANSGVKQNFGTDFLDILTIWKKRLVDGYSGLVPEISILEICKRACQYFIETFEIFEQPKMLKQAFDLNVLFLKSLRPYCQISSHQYDSLLIENFSKTSQNAPNFLQKHADIHLTDELVKAILLSAPDPNNTTSQMFFFQTLQAYLVLRVFQFIVISQQDVQTLQGCIEFYTKNPDLPILSDLIFPLQKTVLAWVLSNSIVEGKSFQTHHLINLLSMKDQLDFYQYFVDLLSQMGLQAVFQDFILESLSRQAKKEPFCRLFNRFIEERKINSELSAPKSQRLGARYINLPENYLEFTNKYMKRTCSLCHKICPPHGYLILCLICGEFQCAATCGNSKSLGNLNKHCKDYHLGQGYFIGKVKFEKIAVNSPGNDCVESKGVYIDKFGQPIENYLKTLENIHHQDFKQFVLNPSFKQELKEIICHQAIGKVLFYDMVKKKEKPMPGLF